MNWAREAVHEIIGWLILIAVCLLIWAIGPKRGQRSVEEIKYEEEM